MRILIMGAGAIGSYLAQRLSAEGQDVVVIESNPRRASELQEVVDALVITGNGASPSVLRQADAAVADLLIAVSNSDGVNALACHVADELGTQRTVARIEDPELRAGIDDLGVDVVIDPGEMAAKELLSLLGQRGASDLIEFAEGRLTLIGGIARGTSPLVGHRLADVRAIEADAEWTMTAIVRHGETIPVHGDTRVARDDHVLLMVRTPDVWLARRLLGLDEGVVERVVILGATRLAELSIDLLLDAGLEVVAIDGDTERCRHLSDQHHKALVIEGDPTDPEVLGELGLSDLDAVVALSGWDDVNLTGCLVGKALGASTAIARFHRLSYVGLLTGTGIDAAVSSRLAAAQAILHFVRRGRIHSVATFKDTRAEALDIEVEPGSAAAGKRLADLELPRAAVVGGIARAGEALVPRGNSEIHAYDRLVVFAPVEAIHTIEALCSA